MQSMNPCPARWCIRFSGKFFLLASVLFLLANPSLRAARLESPDFTSGGAFVGTLIGLSDSTGIVWAEYNDDERENGIYVFRSLDTATGRLAQNARFTASDAASSINFRAISLSGPIAVAVSLDGSDVDGIYVFRNLDTAGGVVTESAKILGEFDLISLSGTTAVAVPIRWEVEADALVFRGLDTISGAHSFDSALRLLPSSLPGKTSVFGDSVSLSGSIAIVGLGTRWYETNPSQGTGVVRSGLVYVFRNVDTATGVITESARLLASDMITEDNFGSPVSLSGTMALVGAPVHDDARGAAYLFRNLDTATGTVTEHAKLLASDGKGGRDIWGDPQGDSLGRLLSLSGNTALVGTGNSYGVYVFRNLDTATGTVTESLKILRNNQYENLFGRMALSLDGDVFLISGGLNWDEAAGLYGECVYTGRLSSMTTLDEGNASRTIERIGFESREDWIIGETTDNNTVVLAALAMADVTSEGRAVYIGLNAGSDNNTLVIDNAGLVANEVCIGSIDGDGNTGNLLRIEATEYASAPVTASAIRLAPGNRLAIEGNYTAIATLLTYLDSTSLMVWTGSSWQSVNAGNHSSLIGRSFASGYTIIGTDPTVTPTPLPPPPTPRPSVTFNGGKKFKTSKSKITLAGTASNAVLVKVKVGKARFKPAKGTKKWTFKTKLRPGKNVIVVHAVGADRTTYRQTKIIITRK